VNLAFVENGPFTQNEGGTSSQILRLTGLIDEELRQFRMFARTRGLSVSSSGDIRPLPTGDYAQRGFPTGPMAGPIAGLAIAAAAYVGKKGVDVAADVVKAYLLSKLAKTETAIVTLYGPNGEELRRIEKDDQGVRIVVKG
jgi:hypothetical protein